MKKTSKTLQLINYRVNRYYYVGFTFFCYGFNFFSSSFHHSLSAFSISSTETLNPSLESAETASVKEDEKMSLMLNLAPHAVEWLECGADLDLNFIYSRRRVRLWIC